jgi:hypothetical protein
MTHPVALTFGYACLMIGLLCIAGCRQEVTHNGTVETAQIKALSIDTVAAPAMLSDLVDSISYIKLGQASLPIGKTDKIEVTADKIFVLDRTVSKSVFVFDTSGRFLYNLGGGNYQPAALDFCLDESKRKVYIYYAAIHKIITYDVDHHKPEKEVMIEGYFHSMQVLDNTVIVLVRDGVARFTDDPAKYDQNRICLFDTNGKYLKGYLNRPLFPHLNYGTMYTEYSPADHAVHIARLYSDTVYTLTKDHLRADYAFDLVNAPNSEHLFQAENVKIADSWCRRDEFRSIWGPFYETQNKIAFYYTQKGAVNMYLLDKQKSNGRKISYFKNDIDKFPLNGSIQQIDDDKIVTVMNAIQLLGIYEELSKFKDFREMYPRFIQVMQGVQPGSNVILAVEHLKKASATVQSLTAGESHSNHLK